MINQQGRAGGDGELIAGVELGGTKCVCTLASGPDRIVAQRSVATTLPDETLSQIENILSGWRAERGFVALGVASFGPVDLDERRPGYGSIVETTKPHWAGTDVGQRLARSIPVPMAFDTDVNGAAVAEMRWGAGRGLRDFAYITVGTGVGVGLIVDGRPTRGIGHCEMGHLRVPRLAGDMLPSACVFHEDCVEGLASGTAIKAALGEDNIDTAGPDHPIWDRVANALACLCHALVCSTGPMRIVIGGGVIARQPHLLPRIERLLRSSINGYLKLPNMPGYVVLPELGEQAGPLGPIALALARLTGGI